MVNRCCLAIGFCAPAGLHKVVIPGRFRKTTAMAQIGDGEAVESAGKRGNACGRAVATEAWHCHGSVATKLWRGSEVGDGEVQAQFPDFPIEGGAIDAKETCRFGLVASRLAQGLEDPFGG